MIKYCLNNDCGLPFITDDKRRKFCSTVCYWITKREQANRPYPMIRINGKRVYLHRYIYERATGETLTDNDIIHHIDENPFNRDPSNLEKISGRAAHLHKHNYHKRNEWQPDSEIPF